LRSLQVARQTLDRDTEVRFDAYGLVQQEGRLQADIRIVTLPAGEDPDSIIRADPARWPQLVAQAQPVVAYVIGVATQDLDMRDAKAKTAVAQQIIPLIKDIADPIERDHYWQELARALRVDERALRQTRLPETQRSAQPSAAAKSPPKQGNGGTAVFRPSGGQPQGSDLRQAHYLSQCLHQPYLIQQVNERLAQCGQTAVTEKDFLNPEDRAIMQLLPRWTQTSGAAYRQAVVTIDELWDILDAAPAAPLTTRAQYLLSLSQTPDVEMERLADQLMLSVLDWRLEKTRELVNEVEQYYKEAQIENDAEAVEIYQQLKRELPLVVWQLNKARNAMTAANRRRVADKL
jgi:DNA primase